MSTKLKSLTKSELQKALKGLTEWKLNPKGTTLTKTVTFQSHVDALVFIARVSVHAQVLDHHPEIVFTYAKVKVVLTTDTLKALSKKDIALAERIDSIVKKGG